MKQLISITAAYWRTRQGALSFPMKVILVIVGGAVLLAIALAIQSGMIKGIRNPVDSFIQTTLGIDM